MSEYPQAILSALEMVSSPYVLGAKWPIGTATSSLRGPVDCSGFSRWVLSLAGVTLPDGSYNQIKVCEKLPGSQQTDPPPLSLGFYQSPKGDSVDHVVVSCGNGVVIEARGYPHNQVILRPVSAWTAQPGFLGFYAAPGTVKEVS
jgi:cell wall-associated NlpC family hydrolase